MGVWIRFFHAEVVLSQTSSHRTASYNSTSELPAEILVMADIKKPKVSKSEQAWREELTDFDYQITREAATEAPFTGEYTDTETPGTYVCKCCGEPLFSSQTKYHSHSGWPAFYAPIAADSVSTKVDTSHFMVRTEALCSSCDAHLGHVFPDGPQPTGMRWCINSASLKLEEDEH